MNRSWKERVVLRGAMSLAILGCIVATVSGAYAKDPKTNSAERPAALIAHVALPGNAGTEMLLRQNGDHEYLYILRNSKEGFTIVDVTNPRKPNVLERVSWPNGASAGRLEVLGSQLGIAESAEGTAAVPATAPRTETVELLDLSDPANPQTIQTFGGVTSVLTDAGRHLVYVTNGEGLWVLRQNQKTETRNCTTDDATAPVPACE